MGKTDSIQVPVFEGEMAEYERDFCAWSIEQAARLRLLRVPGVDVENIAEEIESLARKDRQELLSRLEILLAHLLKCRYQPDWQTKSWLLTILEQRNRIVGLLEDSPSLRPALPALMVKAYQRAAKSASLETGLDMIVFPGTCEWTIEQTLDIDFLPESR